MPALPSSPISPVLEQLRDLPAGDHVLLAGECPGLAAYLALVPDPRDPRGVRHTLTSLLLASVAAVLAGARSLAAIGEWAADAPPQVMAALGVRQDRLTGRFEPPDEATIRRVLESVDAAALDAAVGSWLAGRLHRTAPGRGHGRNRRRAVAVDGKTSEVIQFGPLLEPLDLAGAVVTADGLHTQREHAEFLVTRKHAHYILVVKKNQPGLHAQLKNLPWRNIPVSHRQHGHGREERRSLQAATVAAGLAFPHAAQAIRVTRRGRPLSGGKWRTVIVYAVTSLTVIQATPGELAAWVRAHWQIEALHHIRDVSYDEDASQVRTGSGPQVMATLRNIAVAILRPAGHSSIAAACRHHARDATRILTTLGLCRS